MVIIPDKKDADKAARNRKSKKGRPVKPPKRPEMDLRQMMGELWQKVLMPATHQIEDMLKNGATPAEIAHVIEQTLDRAEREYRLVSDSIIDRWKMGVSKETRMAMQSSLRKGLGIDTLTLFDDPRMADALELGAMEMAQLIVTIPGRYLGDVARAVADNYMGKSFPNSRTLQDQIRHLGAKSDNWAKLIARDQTSKLTGMLNQTRQQAIGIDEYIWRTAQDERVVGNPGGKYPDVKPNNQYHGNHYEREGKTFKWAEPPPDGHPGHAIQCRCHAEPIINPARIAELAKANMLGQ